DEQQGFENLGLRTGRPAGIDDHEPALSDLRHAVAGLGEIAADPRAAAAARAIIRDDAADDGVVELGRLAGGAARTLAGAERDRADADVVADNAARDGAALFRRRLGGRDARRRGQED